MRVLAAGLVAVLALSLVPSASAQDATLSGQVVDQHGVPVAGAQVWLYQYGYASEGGSDGSGVSDPAECDPDGNCSRIMAPESYHQASAVTDAQGRFSIAAHGGQAELSVNKDGYASSYQSVQVDGQPVAVTLVKFPDKTAHVVGTVRGGSGALPYVSVSIENPEYGVYECSVRAGQEAPRPMPVEPKPEENASGGGGSGQSASSDAMIAPGEPYPGYRGCAITVQADGSFDGHVTPGYSILRFYHDSWRGDGQEYYSVSRILDLPANETSRIDVQLTARPGPNAVLAGHVIDAATKAAIPGAQISFSSQDAYGWANAQADADGSYKVALRSGFTQIHVWAEGYFPWEGQVTVRAGATDQRFVIELSKGEARWGGCCIAYAEGAPMPLAADGSARDADASGGGGGTVSEQSASSQAFQDLGGGLGPYDPATADGQSAARSEGAPGFEALALALGLLAIVLVRRK